MGYRTIILIVLCATTNSLLATGQIYVERQILRKDNALILVEAITAKDSVIPLEDSLALTDSISVVAFAEKELFRTYGKRHILNQRPYEVYQFNRYWYVGGTMPENMKGGTFSLVIDAQRSSVMYMMHGK